MPIPKAKLQELVEHYGGQVEEPHAEEEDMHFNLPSSLRILQETVGK